MFILYFDLYVFIQPHICTCFVIYIACYIFMLIFKESAQQCLPRIPVSDPLCSQPLPPTIAFAASLHFLPTTKRGLPHTSLCTLLFYLPFEDIPTDRLHLFSPALLSSCLKAPSSRQRSYVEWFSVFFILPGSLHCKMLSSQQLVARGYHYLSLNLLLIFQQALHFPKIAYMTSHYGIHITHKTCSVEKQIHISCFLIF